MSERVLLICVVLGAFLVILRTVPLILSPYQIDYGEGLILDGALRIRHAQPLYPNPFAFPVVLHVYGPVAYAAAASVLPSGTPSFPAGRFMILICSAALSLLLSTILRRLTGSWRIGLSFGFSDVNASGVPVLALPVARGRHWCPLFRDGHRAVSC
jgi:hypothetical protein